MTIGPLKKATPQAVKDLVRLMSQLRGDGKKPKTSAAEVRSIVTNKSATMIAVQENEHVIGVGTLYIIQKVGKREAHIEDVVVDEANRGQGLGKKIMQALIATAKKQRVSLISLTSRPEREAANGLYEKLGFELAKTNAYRMRL